MQHVRRTTLVVLAMIALLAAPAAATRAAAADAEQEIRQVVADIAAAYGSNEVETYFSYFAEEMTQWWPNARRIGRQEYYDMWTGVVAGGGGNVAAEVDDLRIHVAPSGDAGVASYLLNVTRKNAPAERAHVEYRMSLTFLKREGTWKAVHLHFSTPPRPSAPSAEELEVRDTLNRVTANYGANDLDGYFFFFAPEFDWWGPGGRSDKESYREFWTDLVDRTGGLESAENSDLQVHVSPGGDLAVGSYLLTVRYKNPGSGDRTVRWQMSPTLVKRGGNWKMVHIHFQRDPD